jgi:aspartyl-tRNA(Asn)/glutamyl-tRNA(Gln) amidotransferase subunit A
MALGSEPRRDLVSTRQRLREGAGSAASELESCIDRMTAPPCRHAFLRNMAEDARRAVATPGQRDLPLAGLAVSVKDLFDVAGQSTHAGSRVLQGCAPASSDAVAVARLRAAGAVVLGRTNMTEFAFSGVGINPHHGTPAAWDGRHQCAVESADGGGPSIPGGSSSGAAVSVASGAAFVGLGSDTGGSIRIPAALNGIVGFKSTASLVPCTGALPLSTTLDTVCALTRSVRDAILVHEVLAARQVVRDARPTTQFSLALARALFLDGLEPAVARAFERSVRKLADAGATIVEIELPQVHDLQEIQASGGFSAAESFAWHRMLLRRADEGKAGLDGAAYDPRVRARIERGAGMLAWEYLELFAARRRWIEVIGRELEGFDAVLSPTLPILGPSIASVAPGAPRDQAFFAVNAQLLRNTSVVNMFDGCAISIPCHLPGEMPVGLMLWQGAGRDDTLLSLALLAERVLAP